MLYKFPAVVNEAVARAWTMASRDARYCFYDDAQHLATATEWRLKLDRGGVDVDVHSDVEMDFDTDMCFATFYHAHHSEVCRLAFPTEAACQKFSSLWSNKIFENQQSGGEDTFWDPEPVTQPAHWSTTPAAPRTGQRIVGVTPGAGRYSFLLQQGTVSVEEPARRRQQRRDLIRIVGAAADHRQCARRRRRGVVHAHAWHAYKQRDEDERPHNRETQLCASGAHVPPAHMRTVR